MDFQVSPLLPIPSRKEDEQKSQRVPGPSASDFGSLLSQQLGAFSASSASTADSPLTSPSSTPMFPSLDQLLAFSLLQMIERLMSAQQAAASVPRGLPAEGPISQDFHEGHKALDIATPVGTPIQATMDGQVVYSGWNNEGYGNLVIVENGPYKTYFAHLDSIPVQNGQTVRAGEVVGLSGSTGNSTGPHLHYEVRLNGEQVLPDRNNSPA